MATELLHWWNLRTQRRWPAYAGSMKYWVLTAMMVLIGGAVSWFQLGGRAEAVIAFELGVTAPLLLQKLTGAVPEPSGGKSSGDATTTRSFFRW